LILCWPKWIFNNRARNYGVTSAIAKFAVVQDRNTESIIQKAFTSAELTNRSPLSSFGWLEADSAVELASEY